MFSEVIEDRLQRFAMPPVTGLEYQIDLFGEHQGNAPAQPQRTEMRFFAGDIIQRRADALLQALQPGVTQRRAKHVFRSGEMQHVQPVGEGFPGVVVARPGSSSAASVAPARLR